MSLSLIISIIAAVISAIAIVVSIWTHNRNHKLQARIVALEEAREKDRLAEKNKANLTAEITTKESPRSGSIRIDRKCYLKIENKGLSEARKIELVLDDKAVMEHPAILKTQSEIKQVGPESSFRYELAVTGSPNVPSHAEMTWEDDSAEPGEYSTTLTL